MFIALILLHSKYRIGIEMNVIKCNGFRHFTSKTLMVLYTHAHAYTHNVRAMQLSDSLNDMQTRFWLF